MTQQVEPETGNDMDGGGPSRQRVSEPKESLNPRSSPGPRSCNRADAIARDDRAVKAHPFAAQASLRRLEGAHRCSQQQIPDAYGDSRCSAAPDTHALDAGPRSWSRLRACVADRLSAYLAGVVLFDDQGFDGSGDLAQVVLRLNDHRGELGRCVTRLPLRVTRLRGPPRSARSTGPPSLRCP